jgi:hypothetical protein
VLSVLAIEGFVFYYILLPVDLPTEWVWLVEVFAFTTFAWLLPGLVLGGWKALLVAARRSDVRTGTDRGLMILFALWAVGWPTVWAASLALHLA